MALVATGRHRLIRRKKEENNHESLHYNYEFSLAIIIALIRKDRKLSQLANTKIIINNYGK